MILSISWTIAQVQYSQTFLHHAGSPPLLNFFLKLVCLSRCPQIHLSLLLWAKNLTLAVSLTLCTEMCEFLWECVLEQIQEHLKIG